MKRFGSDTWNSLGILVAGLLALFVPFTTLVGSYLILGPVHYLTEIRWIARKNYFFGSSSWPVVAGLATAAVAIPPLLYYNLLPLLDDSATLKAGLESWSRWSNAAIVIAFAWPLLNMTVANGRVRNVGMVVIVVLALLMNNAASYKLWIGLMLPTLIHVYFFTLLFMIQGNMKKGARKWIGWTNVLAVIIVPILLVIIPSEMIHLEIPVIVKEGMDQIGMINLNAQLQAMMGLSDGKSFFFYEPQGIMVQRVLAFAYLHHYLNWFAKTSVIGWHKEISKRQAFQLVALFSVLIALYFLKFSLGLRLAIALSFLHVFLEFPVNIQSTKALFKR